MQWPARTMNNLHLFQLINAAPGLGLVQRSLATVLAEWVIYLVPLMMAVGWFRPAGMGRRESGIAPLANG